ncbi:MAG: two-component system chemotaxis response regulator CheY [Gammaproteobacteria bacterium]|jgi:two-component system chemotaxis response regulator CheY
MNILVVDDSRAMRMIVKKTLRDAGFGGHDITEAEDGVKALAAIKADPPDVVMSDWNMPNMNGIELLEALNEEGIKTRFGFVTTESTAEMRKRAVDAGAKFMIAKPFTAESFQSALQPVLQG